MQKTQKFEREKTKKTSLKRTEKYDVEMILKSERKRVLSLYIDFIIYLS